MANFIVANDENKVPDCVHIELGRANDRKSDFTLTVRAHFDYQRVDFFGGVLLVAIRSGDLRLSFDYCNLSSFLVFKGLNWQVDKSIAVNESMERKSSSSSGAKFGASANASKVEMSEAQESSKLSVTSRAVSTSFSAKSVSAIQGPRPGWRFRNETQELYITGSFDHTPFATIKKIGSKPKIMATFEVLQKNIYVEIAESVLLRKNELDLNKTKILNILIWKWVIKPKFQPFVSRVYLK